MRGPQGPLTILTILILGVGPDAQIVDAQEHRVADDEYLAAYNDSGGWAYWHDSKRGQDPHRTELMVRRCNRPELRVSTKPLFQMRGVTTIVPQRLHVRTSSIISQGLPN
jgi:hypothetical protein